jgi:transcriptional regulator with XRE-family HTH domain
MQDPHAEPARETPMPRTAADPYDRAVGRRLRNLRKRSGYRNTTALAIALHLADLELSADTLGNYERGDTVLPLRAAERICAALDVPLTALIPTEDEVADARPHTRCNVLTPPDLRFLGPKHTSRHRFAA